MRELNECFFVVNGEFLTRGYPFAVVFAENEQVLELLPRQLPYP